MTFLNGLLAFGAAAFTVPLIIHLLHRSRFQTVEWGAMHLLQASRNVNSRRIQWQQLLLLLLRCLLPILLAFAMSRPLFQSWLSSGDQTAVSVALILDDSLSMFALDQSKAEEAEALPGGETRFAKACESAIELLESLPAGSEAAIVLAGAKPQMLTPHSPDELGNQLRQLKTRKLPAGGLDADGSIREALQWLSKCTHPKRKVIILSDFETEDWPAQRETQNAELIELIKKQMVVPELAMMQLGTPRRQSKTSTLDNLSIDTLSTSPSLIAAERETTIIAGLNHHGESQLDGVRVVVFVNDFEIDRQELTLAPKATVQMRTRWTPSKSGQYVVRVQILRDDDLVADNSRVQVIVVQPTVPVLLVDGDRRNEPMQSESDFLRVALSPFSLLQGQKGDLFTTKTIHPYELNEAMLKDYRAVVVCNVAELSPPQQNWLRDFTQRGNGLILFLGDRVRADQYQSWPMITDNGLRVAKLSPRVSLVSKQTSTDAPSNQDSNQKKESEAGVHLKTQQVEFAPVREMSTVSLSSLSQARFEHRLPMSLEPAATAPPFNASVAMRFEDDEPWIIQCTLGEGRCVWVSTSCDAGDSNLPSRPAFVPLAQKLLAYVSRMETGNLTIAPGVEWGTNILQSLKQASDVSNNQNSVEQQRRVTIIKPDGKAQNADADLQGNLRFTDTRLLGPYLVKSSSPIQNPEQQTKSDATEASLPMAGVVVSGSRSDLHESELKSLNDVDFQQLAKLWNANASTSTKELLAGPRSEWHGREFWTWLWSALVVCFLLEILVEQWIAPKRSSHRQATLPMNRGLAS